MREPVAQIFLSYAHFDNARPQGFQMGWVDRLYDALSIEVPTHGVKIHLWRDRRDLEPESYFDESILNAVSNSDAFLAILSPAYQQRSFCLKELTHFLTTSNTATADERGRRVLKVVKRPITNQEVSGILPAQIDGTGEFRFYSEDRQTRNILLFVRPNGDIASKEFWDAIQQLAEAIVRTVKQVESRPQPSHPDVAVYLAETSQDQRQSHRTVRSELMAKGFRVLPEAGQSIPDDYHEARVFIGEQLSRCSLSVHLIGDRSGFIPSPRTGEQSMPITRLQLEQAKLRSADDRSFRRFIWANRELHPTQDDQRNLLADFQNGAALLPSDEFVTEPLQLFNDALLDYLVARVRQSTRGKLKRPCPLLVISHPSDKFAVDGLDRALYEADYETFLHSVHEVETRMARVLTQVEVAIVLFTPADELWARSVLAGLDKLASTISGSRPIFAVLFRPESAPAACAFRSHYCDLVLTCNSHEWDEALSTLGRRLGRTASP